MIRIVALLAIRDMLSASTGLLQHSVKQAVSDSIPWCVMVRELRVDPNDASQHASQLALPHGCNSMSIRHI